MKHLLIAAAGLALATSASALTVTLQTAGQDLRVLASNLGGQTITAWDIDIAFSGNLASSVIGFDTDNRLGQSGVQTLFGGIVSAGLIDLFEVSLLSNAAIAALQNGDAFTLATVHFNASANLAAANFALVNWGPSNQISCAGPGNSTVVCFQGVNVPEPGTLALVGLALGCAALSAMGSLKGRQGAEQGAGQGPG
jgi:hypothetical protein